MKIIYLTAWTSWRGTLEYNVVQENGNWDIFRPLSYLALISPFDIYDILDKGKSDPCLLSLWWLTDMENMEYWEEM